MNYQLNEYSDTIKVIENDGTIRNIPVDEFNYDYKRYLEWLDEGNTPLAAD